MTRLDLLRQCVIANDVDGVKNLTKTKWNKKILYRKMRKQGYYWNPLEYAARHGFEKIVELLLQAGATTERKKDFCAIDYAATYGHFKIVKMLVKTGAVYKDRRDFPKPLRCAILRSKMRIAKYLIKKGVDADQMPGPLNVVNRSNLYWSVRENRVNPTRFLLRIGADFNLHYDHVGNGMISLVEIAKKEGSWETLKWMRRAVKKQKMACFVWSFGAKRNKMFWF